MKYICLLCLLLLCSVAPVFAQEPSVTTDEGGKSEMTFVFDTQGLRDALFSKAKDWVFRTYASGKAAEQFEDAATGHFLVRARTKNVITPQGGMDRGSFAYDLTIDVKDNRARFFVNNIYYVAGSTSRSMLVESGGNLSDSYPANWPTIRKKSFGGAWQEIQAATKEDLVLLAKSFQAAMNKKSDGF